MYGIGVAAADYDNDGDVDLYVTALGGNRLFQQPRRAAVRRRDGARPASPTADSRRARLVRLRPRRPARSRSSRTTCDWSVEKDLFCTLDGKTKSYCTPESYKGQSGALYRNRGDGTFEDVTRKAGLYDPTAKALGVALIDYDSDGWMDLFVANDTQPNRSVSEQAATARSPTSASRRAWRSTKPASRAPAWASTRPTTTARAGQSLDHRQLLERDDGALHERGQRPVHRRGAALDDRHGVAADADVRLLLLRLRPRRPARHLRRQRPRRRRHRSACSRASPTRSRRICSATSARGSSRRSRATSGAALAAADGRARRRLRRLSTTTATSICVVTANNGPARLLRNDGGERNHRLRVRLVGAGVESRRHRRIRARDHARRRPSPWAMVKTGSSYLSQSELPLTFGLAAATRVSGIEVTWPNGRTETLRRQTMRIRRSRSNRAKA